MTIYFTGSTFNQVIHDTIESMDEMIVDPHVEDHQDFYKYIKQNIASLQGMDQLVIDCTAVLNTDEELLAAFEMIRTMYDGIRIIIFAPDYKPGSPFLKKCFEMGILNIITTGDYKILQDELVYCIKKGMSYRDAAKYKDSVPEKISVKHTRKTVMKRMIGIAGTCENIGVTHNAIVLANFFRQKGYMVALVEKNNSGAFETICSAFDEKTYEDGYYTLNGIDYYTDANDEKIQMVQEHPYNVILMDFGCLTEENKDAFERCEDRLLIAGARPWEMEDTNRIFPLASRDVLAKYVFCFNFVPTSEQEAIRDGMGTLDNVHFLTYTERPFEQADFSDAAHIFAEILPEEVDVKEKTGILKKLLHKKQEGEGNRVPFKM